MNKKLMILAAAVLTFAACTTKNEEKPLYIWIDASTNFPDFANSKENIPM